MNSPAHRAEDAPGQQDAAPRRHLRPVQDETPSFTSSIADSIVIKDDNLFLLTSPDACVPLTGGHGLGLYYNDCRFLRGYELRVGGMVPRALAATAGLGFKAVFQLSGPDFRMPDGERIPQEELGIRWDRLVDGRNHHLHDLLVFENFGARDLRVPVELQFEAGFEDVFAVRELSSDVLGTLHPPEVADGSLRFRYEGIDGRERTLTVAFAPAPQALEAGLAQFELLLPARARQELIVTLAASDHEAGKKPPAGGPAQTNLRHLQRAQRRSLETWLADETAVQSDSLALNRILDRASRDLRMLRNRFGRQEYFAAGLPWFATLFGRDSLVTALQTLAYNPRLAEGTLRLLARYQGDEVDPWRDEEPGKVLHEFRAGEMARGGLVPHTPYYGTVDATPLFLILLARHAGWTGSLDLFEALRGNVERALEWVDRWGDPDRDGYLEYERKSSRGLDNQGWKDSYDGIVNLDGSLALAPIATVETQAYVYAAKQGLAGVFRRAGDAARADRLAREAARLKERFNQDFWMRDQEFYAVALDGDKRQVQSITSNPGHALWAGIATPNRARAVAKRLMAPEMFSGWGVRTLSSGDRSYNPNGYHVGSVWPHDNSFIVQGLRNYGFDESAARVMVGLIEAAMNFEEYRLPELFAGFPRDEYGVPVRYPVACRPQAWAAASVPAMLESMLGLTPEAFDGQLRVVRPILPGNVHNLELRGLRVGTARASLRFENTPDGTSVRVLETEGPLDIVIEGADVVVRR